MFYVYILKSQVDGTCYKGFTTDYKKRLQEHNAGLSKYTATKIPWDLIFVEEHTSKSEALKREKSLKKCKASYFEWLVTQHSNLLNK